MSEFSAEVVFRPASDALAYLPEGPCQYGPGHMSWVAIQHGGDSKEGSINVLDLASGENRHYVLPGRPGFAFPTANPSVFLTGFERKVGFFDVESASWVGTFGEVEGEEEGTIINDGTVCGNGVLFGTKDVAFTDPKAGLYLWLPGMNAATHLRGGQTCSNGKVILSREGGSFLLDIDTPTRVVVEYPFDLENQRLGNPQVVVDLQEVDAYPDGMVITPDQQSVIIAMYNPNDVESGEARQHSLANGELEAVWKVPGSPRVTCPLLAEVAGEVLLFLTTAVEHMSAEEQARHPNAGCLFQAATPFGGMVAVERLEVPEGAPKEFRPG